VIDGQSDSHGFVPSVSPLGDSASPVDASTDGLASRAPTGCRSQEELRLRLDEVFEAWRSASLANDVTAVGDLVRVSHVLRDTAKTNLFQIPGTSER
jgi:hypothetical protein